MVVLLPSEFTLRMTNLNFKMIKGFFFSLSSLWGFNYKRLCQATYRAIAMLSNEIRIFLFSCHDYISWKLQAAKPLHCLKLNFAYAYSWRGKVSKVRNSSHYFWRQTSLWRNSFWSQCLIIWKIMKMLRIQHRNFAH